MAAVKDISRDSEILRGEKLRILVYTSKYIDDGVQGLEADQDFTIKLTSKIDKKDFKVDVKYAKISKIVDVCVEEDRTTRDLEIDTHGHILEYIVQYMNAVKGDDSFDIKGPLPNFPCAVDGETEESLRMVWNRVLGEDKRWHAEFMWKVARSRKDLILLTQASNQYGINGLLTLCLTMYATLLKFCKQDDIDRILDPNITEGKLLPMRKNIKKSNGEKRQTENGIIRT
ncbi:hypothetical protein AAMO2058_000799000 [Amorphochlora amoebiformis]|eukprot:121930-Amorphochlora_amoeboformis.AAC.1